ncbi:MAG TPA: hypothetical protein VEH27_09435 [Methylomirabilota bacterium]|nr:hypothetical protein [Methylomirabilota bacterium]
MSIPEFSVHLARWCELPVFSARLVPKDFKDLCAQAADRGLAGLVVPSGRVMEARTYLEDTEVKVVAAIGFPAGAMDADVKRYEAEAALDNGAHEIELLVGLHSLGGDYPTLTRELRDVIEALDEAPIRLSVPLHQLQPEETERFVEVVQEIGPDWVTLDYAPGSMPSLPLVLQTLRKRISAKVQIKGHALPSDPGSMEALLNAGAMKLGLIV